MPLPALILLWMIIFILGVNIVAGIVVAIREL